MIFRAMVPSYALKGNRTQTLLSAIGWPGLRSPVGTNCWNSVRTVEGNIQVLLYGTSFPKTVSNIKKQSHTCLNRMVGQNISIAHYWINPKQCDNMHVYRQLFGRMQLKRASISIIDNQCVILIGFLRYNCGMALNQTYHILGLLVVGRMFSYPKTDEPTNSHQSLKIWRS